MNFRISPYKAPVIHEGPLAAPGSQPASPSRLSRIGTRISATLPRLPSRDDVRAGFSIARDKVKDVAVRAKNVVGNALVAAKTKLTPLDIHQARVDRHLQNTQDVKTRLGPEEGEHVRAREQALLAEKQRLRGLETKSSLGRRMLRGTANAVRSASQGVHNAVRSASQGVHDAYHRLKNRTAREQLAGKQSSVRLALEKQARDRLEQTASLRQQLAELDAQGDVGTNAEAHNKIVQQLRDLGSEAGHFHMVPLPPPPPSQFSTLPPPPPASIYNFAPPTGSSGLPSLPPPPSSALRNDF